jgi:dTDP-4-dehydrorhamnose 3,5-epimerase
MGAITPPIRGVVLTPLRIIDTPGGNVLHGIKNGEPGYAGFGEAYFSTIEKGAIKAWKRHRQMTLNLVVPIGAIHFKIYDDRPHSRSKCDLWGITLSREHYFRLTVPPMLWLGFEGIGERDSMLLNIADIIHDPNEVDKKDIHEIQSNWG